MLLYYQYTKKPYYTDKHCNNCEAICNSVKAIKIGKYLGEFGGELLVICQIHPGFSSPIFLPYDIHVVCTTAHSEISITNGENEVP